VSAPVGGWKKKRKGERKGEGERGIYAPKVAACLICRMAVWQLDHDQLEVKSK
jgi:hypothetical protein